ncbi:MAG: glycerophosphodiester phosphodiesterase, partial [Shewanella sp.]
MKLRPISSLSLGLLIATSALLAGCNNDDDNAAITPPTSKSVPAQVGERPLFLVRQMQDSTLKTRLEQCTTDSFYRSEFSIGHRGAPMKFPEHTKE